MVFGEMYLPLAIHPSPFTSHKMKQVAIFVLSSGWLMGQSVLGLGQVIPTKTLDSLAVLPFAQQLAPLQQLKSSWVKQAYPTDTSYIRLVVDLAQAHAKTGNVARSVALLQDVLAGVRRGTVRSSPASDQVIKAYYRLVYGQQQEGHLTEARQTGQEGIELARPYTHSRWASNLYTTLAYLWSTEGDYERAASLAERGATLGTVVRHPYCIANGFFEQAKALRFLDRLPQAHRAINQSIAVGRQYPDEVDLSLYYNVKATLCRREKRFAETEYWFKQAVALNRSLKDTVGLVNSYTELGYLYSLTHRNEQAIRILTDAVALQSAPSGRSVALENLGAVYLTIGKTRPALEILQRAIHELMPAYKPRRLNQWPDSVLTRVASNKEFLLRIFQSIAETWLQDGLRQHNTQSLANALHTYTLADQLVDYMRWEHTGQQSKLYWRQKTRKLYEGAIETSFRLNDPATAYRFLEKSRAVLLTDKLNELGARQQLPPDLAEQEQALNRNVADLQTRLAAAPPGSPIYHRLQEQVLAEQDKADRFVRQLTQTHPLYFRQRYDNAVHSLAEVNAWLRAHSQSLVSYFVGDSALYVLGVTPSGSPRLLRQPIAAYTLGLREWLRLLHDPAALNSQFSCFVQQGAGLYHTLLEPLHLPTGRVAVSPDGVFLPLEALSRSATQPDYLVHYYAFSYVYSVNRLLNEPAKSVSDNTNESFLGVAPEQFRSKGRPASLLGSAESLRRVGAHFFLPTLLTGEAATRSEFRRLAPQASVVQLYTHADADTLQREPVLYFADTLLHLSELQTGPSFQTQLLVLSACRTGVGSHQKGEGVFSLARGFSALGVPSILTTLWSVESGPTYALTEAFYEGLAKGLDKDIALQQAKQNWLLRAGSRSAELPHNWAGLILIGDSQRLRKMEWVRAGLGGWIGGGLVGLLGLLLFIRLRRLKNRRHDSPQAGNWKPSLS